MATGVVGAQLPHRAALPQLPRREVRKAGKLKQTNLVSQLSLQLEQQRLKLQLSVQREAAIVSACNAACAVCLRFGGSHEFTTTLVGAVILALHNLAAAEAYVISPCPTSTNSQHPVEQLASSGEEATDTDKDEVGTEQASSGPVAFDIFEADDSMWTAPSSHAATDSRDLKESPRCGAARQFDSGDAAAGASAEDHANRASSQPDTDTSALGHLPQPSSCTRQALEDAYSEHRVASFKSKEDFKSRDLVEQCGPLPNNTSPECFDAIAHTCSTSMEDFSSQDLAEQCGSLPTCTSSVLVDAIAPTCNANKEDFNSQDLAEHCGPLPNSPTHVLFDASTYICSETSGDFNSRDLAGQCGPLPNCASPVLLGANAQTCSASNEDCKLATQCGPLVISPIYTTAPHPVESAPETRRTALSSRDEGAHPVESVPGNEADLQDAALHDNLDDRKLSKFHIITSSDAALHDNQDDRKPSKFHIITSSLLQDSTEHLHGDGKLALSSRDEYVDFKSQQVDFQEHSALATRSAHQEDFNSQDLAEQCGPLPNCPPKVFFDASAHTCSANSEDFNSQDLAVQCGPLPNSPSVLFGANAHTCSANKEDFNSQDLAEQCAPLGKDFRVDVAPIIGAYCKRKKPTHTQARTAAKAIISIAKKHEISHDECCSFLQGQSLALWCATSDLWGTP